MDDLKSIKDNQSNKKSTVSQISSQRVHSETRLKHKSSKLLIRDFWVLTKPRVCALAVFCAVIGMLLARPILPDFSLVVLAALGIWLLAAGSFAFNCVLEANYDAKMKRTQHRATAKRNISDLKTLTFAAILVALGSLVLLVWVNSTTWFFTFMTFIGYAFVYTLWLKPHTPQNIVIGGASGAMPPALGWSAITQSVGAEAWVLVLIIFLWTPPHFWALALYRKDDYFQSGLPMLPVTHGESITRLHIFLYSIGLWGASVLPFALGMSGLFFLIGALLLGAWYVHDAYTLWRFYSDARARRSFKRSIVYLFALFACLLIDHFLYNFWLK